MNNHQQDAWAAVADFRTELERFAELECRSLLAEQARQLAHSMRTPLNVVELICETLQIQFGEDRDQAARIGQVLNAVAKLSGTLSDSLNAVQFDDGLHHYQDAAEITAHIVALHGGRVQVSNHSQTRDARVSLNLDAFEAAMLHVLRLIGARGGDGKTRPSLRIETSNDRLILSLCAIDDRGTEIPTPPLPHYQSVSEALLIGAAQRIARNCGGSIDRNDGSVAFSLPMEIDRDTRA